MLILTSLLNHSSCRCEVVHSSSSWWPYSICADSFAHVRLLLPGQRTKPRPKRLHLPRERRSSHQRRELLQFGEHLSIKTTCLVPERQIRRRHRLRHLRAIDQGRSMCSPLVTCGKLATYIWPIDRFISYIVSSIFVLTLSWLSYSISNLAQSFPKVGIPSWWHILAADVQPKLVCQYYGCLSLPILAQGSNVIWVRTPPDPTHLGLVVKFPESTRDLRNQNNSLCSLLDKYRNNFFPLHDRPVFTIVS